MIVVQEQDDIKHLQAQDSDVCFCTRKRFVWSKSSSGLESTVLLCALGFLILSLAIDALSCRNLFVLVVHMRIYEFRPVERSERFLGKSCHKVGIMNRMSSENSQPASLCSLCTFAPFDDATAFADLEPWTCSWPQAESKQKIIDKMVEVSMTCFLRTFDLVNRVARCTSELKSLHVYQLFDVT